MTSPRTRPPAYEPAVVQYVRGVAGRVHSGPHLGKPCCIPPCFRFERVSRGDPLGPPLYLDKGGGWWHDGRPFVWYAHAHQPTGKEKKIPAAGAIHRDKDFMAAAAIAVAWSEESPTDEDTEAEAIRLRRDMHALCDLGIPRSAARRRAGAEY